MTRTILVAGTASHSGKSTIAAGICRALARRGKAVAPFKAQNMSNNARAVISPDGGWGEIGVSQYVQAKAARVEPTTDMNPVLLKPRGDGESQLVVQGEAVGHFKAGSYYRDRWEEAREAVRYSYERLADDYDYIVAEGAGSIAEINLQERDLANIETARMADAEILLVADIERGGVFASIYGTVELLPGEIREKVVGTAINKFRGDESLLASGIDEIEEKLDLPILGVVPFKDISLPSEDSVSLSPVGERMVWGDGDGVPEQDAVRIAVPRLPRISNFTDLEPLAREPGVRVVFTELEAELSFAEAVVIPGTKNTVDDLIALRRSGFFEALRGFEGFVVGICGGYQMLGETVRNAGVESVDGGRDEVEGIGLLPVETEFSRAKKVKEVTKTLEGYGPLAGAKGEVTGYEIHMGSSTVGGQVKHPLGEESAATGRVLGTYLHGLFENESPRKKFVDNLFTSSGKEKPEVKARPGMFYGEVADLVENNLDLEWLYG
ncbi:MAG: cobyric acid synthase [Candidatus Bipolaricaulota bacterium]|nr:cobyric acid synthase [Candidatus Bipolaricaulota bacterium]MBS3792271.1 cobyric acid synthase [Candidatus Bipolaricaulota bacterium]